MPSELILAQAVTLTAAYLTKHKVSQEELPNLITDIYKSLQFLQIMTSSNKHLAAVTTSQIEASINYEYLISFIDGKPYKSLKRHLTAHGMTPAEYRHRFGLPADYPMVARSYGEMRSRIASQAFHQAKAY